ncbi:MAG: hypothetical protein ACRBBP_09410 [Bdellovibrionales bacterium]
MLFEDQLEQLNEYTQSLISRVEENSTFNSLRDKYSSLSPLLQKVLLGAGLFLIVFLTLAGPIANYKASIENMTSFEKRQEITQQVIAFQKKSKSLSQKPREFKLRDIKSEVDRMSGAYSINFLSDQVSVLSDQPSKKLVLGAEQSNFKVKTTKANISQFTALTYSLQKLNKSLLVEALELKANRENSLYFDGSIKVANLFVKSTSDILPKPEVTKKPKSRKRRGR